MTLGASAVAPASRPARLGRLRARTLEDKDLRRNHLLQAAAALFAQTDFEGVTIAGIAQRAGVAKGTAYLYFNSKEAVFLELVQVELVQWEMDLVQALDALAPADRMHTVPAAIARTLARRPMLGRLLVLLHSVIEPRLGLEAARTFKMFLRDLVIRLRDRLVQALEGLSASQATVLVMQMHALVISVTQLASPPPVIAQVLAEDTSLQLMCVAFEPFLTETLTTLLRGTMPAAPFNS